MQVELMSLWLPIVVSAVVVFFASFIVWMVLPHHKKDYKALSNEDPVRDALRAQNPAPGMYCIPSMLGPDGKCDAKNPEFQAKVKEGPWAVMTVLAGWPNMGKSLGMWIVHLLVVASFAAFLGAHALPAGAPFADVFRVISPAAFMTFGLGVLPQMMWKGAPGAVIFKEVMDGLAYALLTGAVFGFLWPAATVTMPL